MSADIQKESVFDDRIIQAPARYAVEKGALSLTNAPFNAIAATSSQQTFNIYVPSENVFVDRALRWSGTAYFSMTATASEEWLNLASPSADLDGLTPILTYGSDVALAPLPLNYLCQTMTATINDTTTVINSQDVLMEVMRLTNYKKNLLQRTCPTMLDKYQWNGTALRTINDPMAGFAEAMNVDEQPNGAFGGFFWTDQFGTPLLNNPSATTDANGVQRGSYTYGGVVVNYANGVPVSSLYSNASPPVWAAATASIAYPLFFGFRSTEKLVLSPFVFADDCEDDTGLFGINNIQLIMNFKSGNALQRILRYKTNSYPTAPSSSVVSGKVVYVPPYGITPRISGLTWNNNSTQGVWQNAVLNVQFLTPSLDVPLPPKSVVPYMEFPRYITQQQNGTIPKGQTLQLQSQTITLPQIPDLLIIYVKATQAPGFPDPTTGEYGDCYLPIASSFNSLIKNPLSVNFDNFSGLLSSHTTEELYQMSVANGLQMPWNTWCGLAYSENAVPAGGEVTQDTAQDTPTFSQPYQYAGQLRPTVGGFLVLKPSKDITLQPGQAPSLVGNFTLQFNLTVVNTFAFTVVPTLYVITANSGFFESIRGSSRIIKGVLSEQDIISAPMASVGTRAGLARLVGGISMSGLSNVFSRAKDFYDKTKPVVSAVKNALPSEGMAGQVKGALGAVGYGTGAGMGGSMGAGRRRGLSARLM